MLLCRLSPVGCVIELLGGGGFDRFFFFLQDHTHRANRNWELWDEDWGLLSPRVAVLAVAVLGGGMALPLLPGLLLRRVP